jgi:hypothetical protein
MKRVYEQAASSDHSIVSPSHTSTPKWELLKKRGRLQGF